MSSATDASRRQARGHPGLRALEVGDGALGCEGAAALARGLAGGGLRRWALEGKGVKGPGVEAIAAAISQHDWGLEELLLSDNPVGDEVGPILHSLRHGVEDSGFFWGGIAVCPFNGTASPPKAAFPFLRLTWQRSSLLLSSTTTIDGWRRQKGVAFLSSALGQLRALELRAAQVTAVGTAWLADGLGQAPRLERLALGGNPGALDAAACAALGDALRLHPALQVRCRLPARALGPTGRDGTLGTGLWSRASTTRQAG